MGYPQSVYHKDYNPHAPEHEKHLKTHCKLVHDEEENKKLGPDWGPHPSSKVTATVVEDKKPTSRSKSKAE